MMRAERRLTTIVACCLLVSAFPTAGVAAGAAAGTGPAAGPTGPIRQLGQTAGQRTAQSEVGKGAAGEFRRVGERPSIRLRQRGPMSPGGPARYVIDVHNPGSARLPSAVVHQLLPPALSSPSATPEAADASADQVRWTVSLEPGETVRLRTREMVSAADVTVWNRLDLGERPRVGSTACVAPAANSAIAGCDTAVSAVTVLVPWWRTWYALAGIVFGVILGALAGIVWFRRRRSAQPSDARGRLVGPADRPAPGGGVPA